MSCISNLINGKIHHRENKHVAVKIYKKTIQRIKLSSMRIAVKGGAVFSQLGFWNRLWHADRHDDRLPSIL